MAKTKIVISEDLEEQVFKLVNELNEKVSLLNVMNKNKTVKGDRRIKKNRKLEKFLKKYLKF